MHITMMVADAPMIEGTMARYAPAGVTVMFRGHLDLSKGILRSGQNRSNESRKAKRLMKNAEW